MADITTKIGDQTLTIREAIEGAGKSLSTSKGAPNAFAKNIEAAGLSLDDPWSSLKEESFLRKLNEVGTEGNFVTLLSVENELRRLSSVGDIAYPYSDVFSPEGKARGLKLEKAQQARRTKKFKGVPEAKKSLTALTEGISVIKDPRTRAAVAFNALVPLRPGEVAGIKVEDIDFETGSFKESYRRVNKIRNELDLPEVALEIIRDAAEKARAEGREYVFLDKDVKDPKKATSNFVNKMTTGMKMSGGVIERFKPFEKAMGRAVAGASDIRKIIPSIIASELGYTTEASAIMGHASFDETIDGMKGITRKHYVSQIITDEGTTAKQALRALQNMYGEVLGLSTLNEIPASMGVDAAGLTTEGSARLAVIPKGSEIVGTQVQGKLTDADLDLIEQVREARKQELRLQAATSEEAALQKEIAIGALDEEAERVKAQKRLRKQEIYQEEKAKRAPSDETVPASNPEARASLERRGFDAKGMAAAINKHLGRAGKLVGAAAVVETARQFIEAPLETGAAVASEIGLEKALGLGPSVAATVALTPTPTAGPELTQPQPRLRFDDDDFQYRDEGFVSKEQADRNREEAAGRAAEPIGFLSP
jgi:integrase